MACAIGVGVIHDSEVFSNHSDVGVVALEMSFVFKGLQEHNISVLVQLFLRFVDFAAN